MSSQKGKKRKARPVRVLSLAPCPPFLICPPISGGAMHIIRPLIFLGSTGNYQISILFPAASPDHVNQVGSYLEGRPGFGRIKGVVCRGKPEDPGEIRNWVPDGALYLYGSSLYREALEGMLRESPFDIVVIETSYMAWTVPLIRKLQPGARIVLDLQNVEHLVLRRMVENGNLAGRAREKYLSEYRKTLVWEKSFWPRVDFCMAVSRREAELFSLYAPNVPVEVVVAGGGFSMIQAPDRREYSGVSPHDLAFVGTMWYPNVHGLMWFMEKVFPLVGKPFPRSRLHIVGSGTPPGRLLEAVRSRQSVVFWGQRRDDKSILAGAGVFIVPLFIGAGVRVKIMNAWSMELPVVSTSIGAEGLACKNGIDILIADTSEEFAGCVVSLLSDPLLREALARNGRRLAEEMYSEKAAAEKLVRFFETVAKAGQK